MPETKTPEEVVVFGLPFDNFDYAWVGYELASETVAANPEAAGYGWWGRACSQEYS